MLRRLSNFLLHRVTRNVFFWMLFAGLPIWLNWDGYGSKANFYTDLLYYAELAFLGYVNNLVLIPRLMDTGRVTTYFLASTVLVVTVSWLALFVLTPLVSDYTSRLNRPYVTYMYNLADYFFFTGFFTGAALLSRLAKSKQRSAQLTELQKTTELNFLKAQINPHLLFNTLNMFYGAAQERSPALPDMLLSLSDTMRYALREGRTERVPLVREVDFLNGYIDLQKLRLEDRARITFNIGGDFKRYKVPPLLFIVLVENAFKYATNHHVDNIRIDFKLIIGSESLVFRSENNIGDLLSPPDSNGVGLANLHKRLGLIYESKTAQLVTNIVGETFMAELSLPLEKTSIAPAAAPLKAIRKTL